MAPWVLDTVLLPLVHDGLLLVEAVLLIKDTLLLIAFSWSVTKDTVTPLNLFGYGVGFLGVAYYNHCKLQALKAKEAQKKVQQSDEEAAGKLLEVRESEGAGKRDEAEEI